MIKLIKDKHEDLFRLCEEYHVKRLELFGSATSDDFEPGRSDIDMVVDFLPMPPAQHAESYFGLMRDLKKILGTEIDLLEAAPINNPYFKQAIEQTKMVLYEAAA